jgi:hypothetical protein
VGITAQHKAGKDDPPVKSKELEIGSGFPELQITGVSHFAATSYEYC